MQDAVAAAAPAPSAAAQELHAVFIDVNGKVQWRANDKAPWKSAAVNDVVQAGVEVRTGIGSRATLRVGRNATIMMDSGTNISVPTMMQDGERLETIASVKNGRADFKVDRVGLTNDFRVVTPSTTLAVKGTVFAVAIGPLKQVEIVGAKRNVMNAIELRYALNNQTVNLSGGATSSSGVQNPAHSAMVSAAPPTVGGTPKTREEDVIKDASNGPAPSESGSSSGIAQANSSSTRTEAAQGNVDSSVAANIMRAVDLANERTDQAIDYMLHAAEQADIVAAQANMLSALKGLADARKAEALAALASHQTALLAAQAGMQGVNASQTAVDQLSSQLNSHLNTFGQQHASAADLLSHIQSIVSNGGNGDLQTLAQQAASALNGMNGALESAQGAFGDIQAQLAAVESILHAMDMSARPDAAAAAAAYQTAMGNLQALAAAGASPAQIAQAANDAVAHLQGLIAGLADQAGTQAAIAAASEALTALANANTALAQSQAALAAIQAARDAAGDAGAAAQLGMVEQLYQQIVAVRSAMATNMMAQAGLIDAADALADQTNSYAEGVFALLGNYWRDVTSLERNAADAHAAQAAAAESQAIAAHGDYMQAVEGANGLLADAQANYDLVTNAAAGVSSAHGNLNQAASDAMSSLGNIALYGNPAMESALLALDALEQALGQIVNQYATMQGVAGNQPNSSGMEGMQAQGSAALQALLEALANAQTAAGQAGDAAQGATDAAAAAAAVQQLALQLAESFGLNMDGALAAAALAYAEAIAANTAGGAANNSAANAQALALLAQANSLGEIASQIDALLAQSNNLSAAALAELQAAQASYVGVNEYGTQVFAGLTVNSANDAVANQISAQAALASLNEMATTSTAYVAALDGAQGAAVGAERSAQGAHRERILAQAHDASATTSFTQMSIAMGQGDLEGAGMYGNRTINSAGMADGAADNAQGYAQDASGYYQTAIQYGNTANALQSILAQYGSNSAEFQAAASAFASQVGSADQAMAAIQANANFYDSVAQMLAGRANTDPAWQAAAQSGDSRAQIVAIAAQLASSAQDAAVLEQTAHTNAQRMFFRSARQYVERAGVAANAALRDADLARAAADHAAALAAQAAANQGGGGGGGSQ